MVVYMYKRRTLNTQSSEKGTMGFELYTPLTHIGGYRQVSNVLHESRSDLNTGLTPLRELKLLDVCARGIMLRCAVLMLLIANTSVTGCTHSPEDRTPTAGCLSDDGT